jgi:hypothetical protein
MEVLPYPSLIQIYIEMGAGVKPQDGSTPECNPLVLSTDETVNFQIV